MIIRCLSCLLLAALVSGCQSLAVNPGQQTVQRLFSSNMCDVQTRSARVTWIDSNDQLQGVIERIRKKHLIGAGDEVPHVDFTRRTALLVEMGRQPSAGYGLALQDPALSVDAGEVTLHVQWTTPRPDRMYAQVITSPCLLVTLPRGEYESVEVRDQDGRVRVKGVKGKRDKGKG